MRTFKIAAIKHKEKTRGQNNTRNGKGEDMSEQSSIILNGFGK